MKYHNYEDAENCIRGFHYLGYEVSFARVSVTVISQDISYVLTVFTGVFLLEAQDLRGREQHQSLRVQSSQIHERA